MRVGLRSGRQEAKARGLGALAHPPNPLRAKDTSEVPLTAFYLNSGLFFISFRSEIYSPDPLERLVCFFPRQLLPW